MSLRAQAAADLGPILLQDGEAITIVNPDGLEAEVQGLSQDIGLLIDPGTGLGVAGRTATVSVRPASFSALGVAAAISNPSQKPWLVRFDDLAGATHTFKIVEVRPDATLGLTVLVVALYE